MIDPKAICNMLVETLPEILDPSYKFEDEDEEEEDKEKEEVINEQL